MDTIRGNDTYMSGSGERYSYSLESQSGASATSVQRVCVSKLQIHTLTHKTLVLVLHILLLWCDNFALDEHQAH